MLLHLFSPHVLTASLQNHPLPNNQSLDDFMAPMPLFLYKPMEGAQDMNSYFLPYIVVIGSRCQKLSLKAVHSMNRAYSPVHLQKRTIEKSITTGDDRQLRMLSTPIEPPSIRLMDWPQILFRTSLRDVNCARSGPHCSSRTTAFRSSSLKSDGGQDRLNKGVFMGNILSV